MTAISYQRVALCVGGGDCAVCPAAESLLGDRAALEARAMRPRDVASVQDIMSLMAIGARYPTAAENAAERTRIDGLLTDIEAGDCDGPKVEPRIHIKLNFLGIIKIDWRIGEKTVCQNDRLPRDIA